MPKALTMQLSRWFSPIFIGASLTGYVVSALLGLATWPPSREAYARNGIAFGLAIVVDLCRWWASRGKSREINQR
jgi:hypothetical protein